MSELITPTIFFNSKAYYVERNLELIAVYEKYQDNNNKWCVSVSPKFFLSGIEVIYFYNDVGSFYLQNILEHLKKCGVI
jgi:hypothetical protein